jgi:hypothetical protein
MAPFIIMYFPPGCVHFFCGYAHHDYCLSLSIQRFHTDEKPLYNLHKGYKFIYRIADTSVDHKGSGQNDVKMSAKTEALGVYHFTG